MKLVFTKLETPSKEIKVTFDGTTYKTYNVAEVKNTGYINFTEEECPDLTKINVNGKFKSFEDVSVTVEASANSNVVVEKPAIKVEEANPKDTSSESKKGKGLTLYCYNEVNGQMPEIEITEEDLENRGDASYLDLIISKLGYNPLEGFTGKEASFGYSSYHLPEYSSEEVTLYNAVTLNGVADVSGGYGQGSPHLWVIDLDTGDFWCQTHGSRYTDTYKNYPASFTFNILQKTAKLYYDDIPISM